MRTTILATILVVAVNLTIERATAETVVVETDGLWSKGTQTRSDGALEECWVRRSLMDGTILELAATSTLDWQLRLSNKGWQLAPAMQYNAMARVDFYQPVPVRVQNTSRIAMEIPGADQETGLIGRIYFGHSIKLASDGVAQVFDLEGSAKAIEWVRNCISEDDGG